MEDVRLGLDALDGLLLEIAQNARARHAPPAGPQLSTRTRLRAAARRSKARPRQDIL